MYMSQTREGVFMAPNQGAEVTYMKQSKVLKQQNELKESNFSPIKKERVFKGEFNLNVK